MQRRTSRIVGVIAGVSLASLSAVSCTENRDSILVLGVLAPPTSTTAGAACVYTANIDGPYLSYGTMDLAFEDEYIPELLMGNQLVAQGNPSLDRIETDNINLNGATVRVTDSSGATLDDYTVMAAGFLLPSSGGTPGLTPYSLALISPKAASAARSDICGGTGTCTNFGTKTLISYVKVFGTTTGGTHIESGEVSIPINVCYGCLVSFPAGSDDAAQTTQPNCLASTSSSSSAISSPCVFGQDQYIDCRTCQGNVACDPAAR